MSTAAATQVWQLGAVELAGAIKSRQLSCLEVVQAHLERMDAVNGSVNAVVVVLAEEARQAAAAADRLTTAGGELPPLHGVPFTIKENIDPRPHADHPRTRGAGRGIPHPGRPRHRADEGRRGDPDRPHQHAQRHRPLALRQRAVGGDAQPRGTRPGPPARPAPARRWRSPPG